MTTENTKTTVDVTEKEIKISRVFDAPPELVWEATTNPEHVTKWWGPNGFSMTIETMDLRVGGVWKHVLHGPDGTDYPNKSIFKEITKPHRIVYSHGGGKKGAPGVNFVATWTFDPLEGNKTKVTIHQVFSTKEDLETVVKIYGAIEGGKQCLGRLGEKLASMPFVIERTFDAPSAMVWKAITDCEQMKEWYFSELKAFKAEVGFETQVDVKHNNTVYPHLWKVTEVAPGKKLSYSWKYAGHVGDSLVTFELFDEGGKTRVKLTHAGLESFLPEAHPQYARGNFALGWTSLIGTHLKEFLESIAAPDRDFVISREFDAPQELVWKAWTNSKHMTKWWGPRDFTNPVCDLDVRVGGAYHITMRSPDGIEYPMEGTFLEIREPERLVMSMDCSGHPDSWHDLVQPQRDKSKKPVVDMVQTVTFDKIGARTKLTVRTRFASTAIRDAMLKVGMNEGWSQSLDRLGESLVKL